MLSVQRSNVFEPALRKSARAGTHPDVGARVAPPQRARSLLIVRLDGASHPGA